MPRRPTTQTNAVFAALSNPDRRKILDLLRAGGRPAGDLAQALPDLPQPAVSRHLKTLREAGLVTVFPRAQQRVYMLEPGRLREIDVWVSRYREFWANRLESLSSQLKGAETEDSRRGQAER